MSENQDKIIKEDRKARKKFLLWMLGFAFIGAIGGILAGYMKDIIAMQHITDIQLFRVITGALNPAITYIMAAIDVVALLWIFYKWKQHEAAIAKWDGESETFIDKLESQVSNQIWSISLLQIINLIVFGMEVYCIKNSTMIFPIFIMAIIILMVYTGCAVFLQSKMVNLIKRMNPEKRGSTYEMSFQSKWMGSCDEAEKLMIYQAGYAAFKAVNIVCTVLTVILSILGLYFEIGLLPFVITGVIWVTLLCAYFFECKKMERRSERKQKEESQQEEKESLC